MTMATPLTVTHDTGNSALVTRRLLTAAVGAIYAALIIATYVQLSKVYDYLGFWYHPPSDTYTTLTVVSAGLLGAFLPMRDWTIVGFAKWVLYFVLFIPALVIPAQQGTLPTDVLILLFVLIFTSAATMMVALRDGRPFHEIRLSMTAFWRGVFAVYFLSNLAIIYVFAGSMNLVGIGDVYQQRDAAGEVASTWIIYVMGTMSGAINPFLLVRGVVERKLVLVALAFAGQLLIYSTLAGKIVLGSTLLTIAVMFAFSQGRVVFGRVYAAVIGFGALGPFISAPGIISGGFAGTISSLIYMRILVLPGVLVGVYSEFFLHYPVTYLSHSIFFRIFINYPYGQDSVGQVIGRYVTPTTNGDVNNYIATFIAGDGITGFGTWGVPVAFLFAAGWLWVLSKLVGRQSRLFTCAMLMAYVMSLANTSLFTSILTGGGAAVGMLMYLYRCAEHTIAAQSRPTGPIDTD